MARPELRPGSQAPFPRVCLLAWQQEPRHEKGRLRPIPECDSEPVQMESRLEKGGGVGQRDGRGEGGSKGLGALPSLGQVAVTCWPEIPSGIAEQVLDPWFPVLLGSQVPSFQEAQGMPFL